MTVKARKPTKMRMATYEEFLKGKVRLATFNGFEVDDSEINPILKPHQKVAVKWALRLGCAALFLKYGLGKTIIQIEILRIILHKLGEGRALITAPLGVRPEFRSDANTLRTGEHEEITDAQRKELKKWLKGHPERLVPEIQFVRRSSEVNGNGIYLTNYESIRDGKLDPHMFAVVSLDEADCLRGFGGTKTFREFMALFAGDRKTMDERTFTSGVKYRFVATATPDPNEFIELLAYSAFLGVMEVGQAKAQPLDAKILTPTGWKLMGDIKTGDQVIAVDGTPTKVLGVFPQGEKEVFRITCTDGSQTECTDDHLWFTKTQYDRNNEGKYHSLTGRKSSHHNRPTADFGSVKTTAEIRQTLKYPNGGNNHLIPNVTPVQFDPHQVFIDPWLLGVLIGDGYLRDVNVSFSSVDDWIIDRVASVIPAGLDLKKLGDNTCDYAIRNPKGRGTRNVLVQHLRFYGLAGKRSYEKRIPTDYLLNSVDIRLALLQGLMDTDGTVAHDGQTSYCTTSEGLAEDVKTLVRSLGGVANIRRTKTTGRDAFKINVAIPDDLNPFSLPRKVARVKPRSRQGVRRYIQSIESTGTKECQCIAIEHESRLYVTDDFIVTHNTRFFKRDSEKADHLTIHPHKQAEFWLWVSSWALFLQKPSDLGFSDEGYEQPEMEIVYHELPVDHSTATADKFGRGRLFREASAGLSEAAKEKRDSLDQRIAKVADIIAESPDDHFILWHDLEDERRAIEKAVPNAKSVYGAQDLDKREVIIGDFRDGRLKYLAGKPQMLGSGPNFQRYCHREIFAGVGYKFKDFIQAIHRVLRFLQKHRVRIDIIYTESERAVLENLLAKWKRHDEQGEIMAGIIKKYGLSHEAMEKELTRGMGVERREIKGERYTLVNNDSIVEASDMEANSVGMIVTSIPFSTQYEYSPNYADLGHSDNNEHFFEQMDFLTPNLLKVLQPGRIAAIHVKDRIVPGGMTGLGFQTVYPFHSRCIDHYTKHGFAYMGMKTIVTDVVRENNQTYRLGWSEQCKDGTKMGVGMPEYLLLFRKPPTDTSNAYGDLPVLKSKDSLANCPSCSVTAELDTWEGPEEDANSEYIYKCPKCCSGHTINEIFLNPGYTRSRWQIDAAGFTRSSGDRLLTSEEFEGAKHSTMYQLFKKYSQSNVYDFEHHVALCESLETCTTCKHIHTDKKGKCKCGCTGQGRLPTTFMLMPPQSWSPEVWTDVTRMRTLNMNQQQKGREQHLCPLQFDIVDRCIEQFTNRGDLVLDPFGGIGTVAYRSVLKGRRGYSIELSHDYFLDSVVYCEMAEQKAATPTLFDLAEVEGNDDLDAFNDPSLAAEVMTDRTEALAA